MKKYEKRRTIILILLVSGFILYKIVDSPAAIFRKYAYSWQQKDFKGMYTMLTEKSKEKITEEQFISRYKKIYGAMDSENIEINFNDNKFLTIFTGRKVEIPFDFSMNTLAGPMEFSHKASLVKERQGLLTEWKIAWNVKMIHPDLDEGEGIYVKELKAIRGTIYDVTAKILAISDKVVSVGLIPGELKDDKDSIINQISSELGVTNEMIEKKLNQSWIREDSFVPVKDIPIVEEDLKYKLNKIKGVKLVEKEARIYPYKEAAAHLIGYINSEGEGVTGIEKIYNEKLRAKNGYDIYIKDSEGNIKQSIAYLEPDDGYNLDLSVDVSLQMEIYNQMKDEVGAAVAINPITGQTLAMVSTPSFDPNMFILEGNDTEREKLIKDSRLPLLNRFQLTYAPGSTFKPITGAIAIEKGVINTEKEIDIIGKRWQPDKSWGNYKITRVSDLDTKINFDKSLIYSDNIYYAKAALALGKEEFLKGVDKFGATEKVPLEFPMKISQISNGGIKDEIQLADTAYGQGQLLFNPFQLAVMYTAFLNEGNIVKPFLEVTTLDIRPVIWKENAISKETAKRVLKGLIQVVNYKNSPLSIAKVPGKIIGGKTGTAELKTSINDNNKREDGWFVGLNTDNPELLMVMRIEGVEERGGSHYVVPKVQQVMNEYFSKKFKDKYLIHP